MTANLINYYSAKAADAHYNRMDTETKRYNQVLENLKLRELNETNRHNVATETISHMSALAQRRNAATQEKLAQIQAYSAQELARYNRMMAGLTAERQAWTQKIDTIKAEETARHNLQQEKLDKQRLDQYERLQTAAQSETVRHNKISEAEASRHNKTSEGIQIGKIVADTSLKIFDYFAQGAKAAALAGAL